MEFWIPNLMCLQVLMMAIWPCLKYIAIFRFQICKHRLQCFLLTNNLWGWALITLRIKYMHIYYKGWTRMLDNNSCSAKNIATIGWSQFELSSKLELKSCLCNVYPLLCWKKCIVTCDINGAKQLHSSDTFS